MHAAPSSVKRSVEPLSALAGELGAITPLEARELLVRIEVAREVV